MFDFSCILMTSARTTCINNQTILSKHNGEKYDVSKYLEYCSLFDLYNWWVCISEIKPTEWYCISNIKWNAKTVRYIFCANNKSETNRGLIADRMSKNRARLIKSFTFRIINPHSHINMTWFMKKVLLQNLAKIKCQIIIFKLNYLTISERILISDILFDSKYVYTWPI